VVLGGTTLPLRLTVENDGNGSPLVSLLEYDVEVELRTACSPSTVLFTRSTADGSVTLSGTSALASFSPEVTASMPARTTIHFYLVDSGGARSPVHIVRLATIQP
jgi:hypothetical protein